MQMLVCEPGLVLNVLKGSCDQLAACCCLTNHRLDVLFQHLVSVYSSGTAQKEPTFLSSCQWWTPTTYLHCRNACQLHSSNVVSPISCWIHILFYVCSVCSSVHVILPRVVGVLAFWIREICGICINKGVTVLGCFQNWGWVKCWSSLMWGRRKYTFQLTSVMC